MAYKALSAVAAVAIMAATSSQAATFDATSAIGANSDHSLHLAKGNNFSFGRAFDFVTPGKFITTNGGLNATLTGNVQSQSLAGAGFDVSYTYDSVWTDGFTPTFKSENGSAFDNVADANGVGYFLDLSTALLEGTGLLEGLTLAIERAPAFDGDETVAGNGGTPDYATQVGGSVDGVKRGANNKNTNYGLANWFMVSSVVCDTTKACSQFGSNLLLLGGSKGDINIDLAPVPLPAGGLLILSALAGLGAVRAKRKAA